MPDRLTYLRLIAAFASHYRTHLNRRVNQQQTIHDMLVLATQPHRCELYFNNIRMRTHFGAARAHLIPVGTTSNEQRHAVFGQVARTVSHIRTRELCLMLTLIVFEEMGLRVALRWSPLVRHLRRSHQMHAWLQHFRLFCPALHAQWAAHVQAPRQHVHATERCQLRRQGLRRRVLSSDRDVDRTTAGEDLFLVLIRGGVVAPAPGSQLRSASGPATGTRPVLPYAASGRVPAANEASGSD